MAVDASSRYALLAVQGPKALDVLQPLTGVDLGAMKYYWFAHGEVASVRATISRTGYTGEDGFEIFVPPQSADRVWQAVIESGSSVDLIPCGLGARDTLRLEAGDAPPRQRHRRHDDGPRGGPGLDRRLEERRLCRRRRVRKQKADGVTRKLVGFEMLERGIARHGYDGRERQVRILAAGSQSPGGPGGTVTSGTQTPYLKKAIGMAYLPIAHTAVGTEFDVDIRGRRARAAVVPMPFYKRQRG